MDILFNLSEKLAICKARPSELKSQDKNSRYMEESMFQALTRNIKSRGELESLPFCAMQGERIEIISGHHRVRAAEAAGLKEIYILLDLTNMSRDRIKSKQLAHNTLSGQDHEGILQEIFNEIHDADAKLEAYMASNQDQLQSLMSGLAMTDLEMGKYVPVALLFIENDKEMLDQALTKLETVAKEDGGEVLVFKYDEYEAFQETCAKVKSTLKIRALPFIFKNLALLVDRLSPEEIRSILRVG